MAIDQLYTKEEAAKVLRCSPKTLGKWICQRKITVYTGRPVLISESAIKEFLNKRMKRARV